MPHKQLDELVKIGKLKKEAVGEREFLGLVRSGEARLKDAQNTGLSIDSRFDLAYSAAHALALAALRWHGYRSENRYLVFQCLPHTLKIPPEQWRVLDDAHRRRNIAEYEGGMDLDSGLIDAVIRVTKEIAKKIAALKVS